MDFEPRELNQDMNQSADVEQSVTGHESAVERSIQHHAVSNHQIIFKVTVDELADCEVSGDELTTFEEIFFNKPVAKLIILLFEIVKLWNANDGEIFRYSGSGPEGAHRHSFTTRYKTLPTNGKISLSYECVNEGTLIDSESLLSLKKLLRYVLEQVICVIHPNDLKCSHELKYGDTVNDYIGEFLCKNSNTRYVDTLQVQLGDDLLTVGGKFLEEPTLQIVELPHTPVDGEVVGFMDCDDMVRVKSGGKKFDIYYESHTHRLQLYKLVDPGSEVTKRLEVVLKKRNKYDKGKLYILDIKDIPVCKDIASNGQNEMSFSQSPNAKDDSDQDT